jgi:hypothetical protein
MIERLFSYLPLVSEAIKLLITTVGEISKFTFE